MQLSDNTLRLLETLENSIDPETEDDYLAQWREFLDGHFPGEIFTARRKKTTVLPYDYRNLSINTALKDYESMLVSQVEGALRPIQSGFGVPNVRANYGTGILTSVFGAEIFTMDEKMNTLPTTRPMGEDKIDEILDAGIPDLTGGFGRQVFEMGEFFSEVFEKYPKIKKYVRIYHPDIQGPLDLAELLIGSDLFYLFYDEPEKVKALLTLMTETYKRFLNRWLTIVPQDPEINSHWGAFMHRGQIVLRDDSAMNISPELYREFALPFDRELLQYYHGGVVHFCGRGDHYIDLLASVPELTGINMSQPELNDMEKIYRSTVDKGIPIFAFSHARAEADKNRPGGFNHRLC